MICVAKFYITTAIPYVNAKPHLGHALEFVQADAIYRYHQLSGFQAFLTTGADENSLKNVQAAEEEGITPAQLCERNAEKFRQLARDLPLSSDSFLRSSASRAHWQGVHKLWKLCEKSGDIYKKTYRGLYCVGCEAFYTESELKDGLCPEHRKRPELVEEENYFFRLSKYQKQLERLIKTGRLKIIPEGRKNEALAFIKSGLEDFSISRSRKRAKGWGVPVPGDNEQIIYVWIDALAIYLTAIGYGKDERPFKRLWPADLHVIGKGILRFHAIYWPAILLSACLPLPKALFVHGYITTEGQKMSKSLGNMLDPQELISRYGSERLRYYLLKEISPFEDGDFSERAFMEKTNAELVDNFSNLFYRITTFIENHFHGKVPKGKEGKSEKQLKKYAQKKIGQYKKSFASLRLNEALAHAIELSSELNRYFQGAEPWETVKKDRKKAAAALYTAANALNIVCTLLYPFLPRTSQKAVRLLNSKINITNKFTVKAGTKIKSEMLFRRIELPSQKEKGRDNPSQMKKADNPFRMAGGGYVKLEDFQRLDLRIATITEVKDHPDADKLFLLQVDLGSEKRQLVAGMKGIYKKEELLGKQIVVLTNLEPAELRGEKSEGMLLAADDGTLISPAKKLPNGMSIR